MDDEEKQEKQDWTYLYLVDGGWWCLTGRLRWRFDAEPSLNSFSSMCPVAVVKDTEHRCTVKYRAFFPSDEVASVQLPCSYPSRCYDTPWNCAASPPNCWALSINAKTLFKYLSRQSHYLATRRSIFTCTCSKFLSIAYLARVYSNDTKGKTHSSCFFQLEQKIYGCM